MIKQSFFHHENQFNDNIANQINIQLLKKLHVNEWITLKCLPLKIENETLFIVGHTPLSTLDHLKLKKTFSISNIEFSQISKQEWTNLICLFYEKDLLKYAVYNHHKKSPSLSALTVFSKKQYILLFVILYSIASLFFFFPYQTSVTAFFILNIIFILGIGFRVLLCFSGQAFKEDSYKKMHDNDDDLPIYSILLPVYKEPEIICQLVQAIDDLDYPRSKKDALLIIEQCDLETQEALKSITLPEYFTIIYLPKALPQTKPKACNYGLIFAQGEYVVIYDAEDIPEKDQLRRALIANQKLGEKGLCVQAALNFYNQNQNVLTQLFTMEYSYLYDYMLPGLHSLNLPIPLGGTSNHFHTKNLKDLGAWDPFNTTEDADLGMRAFIKGYKIGVIRSCTWEEANSKYGNWIRQRSRWIKGFFHTALVHNRHVFDMLKKGFWKEVATFELLMAIFPLALLISPLLWSLTILSLAIPSIQFLFEQLPRSLLFFNYINFMLLNIFCIQMYMMGLFHRSRYTDIHLSILAPIYHLICHSVAAVKALWQLFANPFYWEKTTHGLFTKSK